MCQRLKYVKHKSKSISLFKDKTLRYMSIIIDGMDQDKSNVPRSSTNAKEIKAVEPYPFSVVGVMVHGFEYRSYLVKPTWKHDTNLTIHLLMKTLVRVLETTGRIPPILYLQMDNCWRENKNQYMMTFLSLLIKLKVFVKIKLNFDLVGHTHEDIDQMFKVLNEYLKREHIPTFERLLELVQNGFVNNQDGLPYGAEDVDAVGLWKEWFSDLYPGLHNHIYPHCFKVIPSSSSAKMEV